MRRLRALRLLVAASIVVGVFAVAPAQAHNDCIALGANVACTRDSHSILDACDREADGQWVVAQAINGRGDQWYVWDTNGSQSGCGNKRVTNPPMTYYWLCEANNLYGTPHTCTYHQPV